MATFASNSTTRDELEGDRASNSLQSDSTTRDELEGDRASNSLQSDSVGRDLNSGFLIPGEFHLVEVTVKNPDGELLPEVNWLISSTGFSTATQIGDNAVGFIYLLAGTYRTWIGIAESGTAGESPDLAYYTGAGQNDVSPGVQDTADIILEPATAGGSGLIMGEGISLGSPF